MSILLSLQELLTGKEGGCLLSHAILCALSGIKRLEDIFFSKDHTVAHKATITFSYSQLSLLPACIARAECCFSSLFKIAALGQTAYVVNVHFSVLAMGQNENSSYLCLFSWTYRTTSKQTIVR